MSSTWTDDPVRDAARHDAEAEAWAWENCPICDECGEPIQDDYAYCIGDAWYHEECIEQYRRRMY